MTSKITNQTAEAVSPARQGASVPSASAARDTSLGSSRTEQAKPARSTNDDGLTGLSVGRPVGRGVAKASARRDPGMTGPGLTWRRGFGFAGLLAAAPFFAWFALGVVDGVPSMVDVFGVAGLRIPASITIGGLLMAAVGFFET